MTTVFTSRAIDCPPLYVPTALIDPSDGDPAVYDEILTGATTPPSVGVLAINQGWERTEGLGRYGGGAYATAEGLEVTVDSGLTVALAAGGWIADGYRYKAADTLAITTSTYSWLYVGQDGLWGAVSRAAGFGPGEPPSLPAGYTFRRRVLAGAADISEIDGSGAFEMLQGGILLRKTADETTPTDTPPAGARFWTKSAVTGDYWLWDGEEYIEFASGSAAADLLALIEALQQDSLMLRYYVGLLFRHFGTLGLWSDDADATGAMLRALQNPWLAVP